MPTGYTACIKDGVSFNNFVLQCARAMGACIMQRDDSIDVLPKIEPPSDYYTKALQEDERKLKDVRALSKTEADRSAKEQYDTELAQAHKAIQDNADLKIKYEAMLSKVNKWEPPTKDHIGLKNFMIEQLQGSIQHDCSGNYYQDRLEILKPLSGEEWKNNQIESILHDIEYHKKEGEKDLQRTNNRNAWITELYSNLQKYEEFSNLPPEQKDFVQAPRPKQRRRSKTRRRK